MKMAIGYQKPFVWNRMFTLKAFLLSLTILSAALLLTTMVPSVMEFIDQEVPLVWSSMLSWLKPPYLYVVINGIILTIAASSKFQTSEDAQLRPLLMKRENEDEMRPDFGVSVLNQFSAPLQNPIVEIQQPLVLLSNQKQLKYLKIDPEEIEASKVQNEKEFPSYRTNGTPKVTDSIATPTTNQGVTEKPLLSVRNTDKKKNFKPNPEGVAKSNRNDTLESTWKAITDGHSIPPRRHLRKADTWRQTHEDRPNHCSPQLKKFDTFHAQKSRLSRSPTLRKLRKDPSLSQDELNRRVEAFITKFNEEMRLQREESLNSYMEMINRGSN